MKWSTLYQEGRSIEGLVIEISSGDNSRLQVTTIGLLRLFSESFYSNFATTGIQKKRELTPEIIMLLHGLIIPKSFNFESAAVICQVENENKNSFWLRSMF
jgi:hypothetical protein